MSPRRISVPAGMANKSRRRSPAAGWNHGNRRVPLQQGHQRRLVHQRQSAGGAIRVHWSGQPPAVDGQRINNTSPNIITSALVMGNQSVGSAWNLSGSLSKTLYHGLAVRGPQLRRGQQHHRSRINGLLVGRQQPDLSRPNNPGVAASGLRRDIACCAGVVLALMLQLRNDDGVGVLGARPTLQELLDEDELRLQRRHERRRFLRERSDLHPA